MNLTALRRLWCCCTAAFVSLVCDALVFLAAALERIQFGVLTSITTTTITSRSRKADPIFSSKPVVPYIRRREMTRHAQYDLWTVGLQFCLMVLTGVTLKFLVDLYRVRSKFQQMQEAGLVSLL
jgi:hypothetical protein